MGHPRHTDRARAESFGAGAADYDRFRPACPEGLLAHLVASRPRTVLDDDAVRLLHAVYARYAPGSVHTHAAGRAAGRPDTGGSQARTYRWEEQYTTAEWVGLVATFSDHRMLPADQRLRLLDAVTTAIDDAGGVVRGHGEALALFSAPGPGT